MTAGRVAVVTGAARDRPRHRPLLGEAGATVYLTDRADDLPSPGSTRADAQAFAEPVAARLAERGFSVEPPRFTDLEPSPVVCLVARQPSAPAGSTQRSGADPPAMP